MVYVSIGLRIRVEVEALNMVEALGGYTRHRTVSVLKKINKNNRVIYRVIVAPAISGQSITYGYHKALVLLAKLNGLPLCNDCVNYESRGGFVKRTTEGLSHDERIKTCVVDDITGFLAPEVKDGRRTSPISFSYMVPDIESAKVAIDSQFHVRYDFQTKHQPFTIESGTAIYTLSIAVDVDRIGRLLNGNYVDNRINRIELAFKALEVLIEGFTYGAKKSRYLPVNEVVGAIAAISNPIPFMVSPPRVYRDGSNYIKETIKRAKHYRKALTEYKEDIKIMYMDKEGIIDETEINTLTKTGGDVDNFVERVDTFTELIEKIINKVFNTIKTQSTSSFS